jgi:hypothetical protein
MALRTRALRPDDTRIGDHTVPFQRLSPDQRMTGSTQDITHVIYSTSTELLEQLPDTPDIAAHLNGNGHLEEQV